MQNIFVRILWVFSFFWIQNLAHANAAIDLTQQLLSQVSSSSCSDYNCMYLKQNLQRDSFRCQVSPQTAFRSPSSQELRTVKGYLAYVGFWPSRYVYHVVPESIGQYSIQIKIHFSNQAQLSAQTLQHMQNLLREASEIWTTYSPLHNYFFRFEITNNRAEADFSVHLKNKYTRGPYYQNWSTVWSAHSLAHELGHMMGLDDEYGTISQHENCDPQSLMCLSGIPQLYHYYQIFKRIHVNPTNCQRL